MRSDDTVRWTNDVFTRRDNRKRQKSSFHSSASLDVTLHLFISSLSAGSKGGWGVARLWSWKYQMTLNIEPSCHTKCIWIMVCWVNKHLYKLGIHMLYYNLRLPLIVFYTSDQSQVVTFLLITLILSFNTKIVIYNLIEPLLCSELIASSGWHGFVICLSLMYAVVPMVCIVNTLSTKCFRRLQSAFITRNGRTWRMGCIMMLYYEWHQVRCYDCQLLPV